MPIACSVLNTKLRIRIAIKWLAVSFKTLFPVRFDLIIFHIFEGYLLENRHMRIQCISQRKLVSSDGFVETSSLPKQDSSLSTVQLLVNISYYIELTLANQGMFFTTQLLYQINVYLHFSQPIDNLVGNFWPYKQAFFFQLLRHAIFPYLCFCWNHMSVFHNSIWFGSMGLCRPVMQP